MRFQETLFVLIVDLSSSVAGANPPEQYPSLHMLANGGDTEGLFHAAIMESGSRAPIGDISSGQQYYNYLIAATDCQNANDTLQCLREAPYGVLKAAMDTTPNTLSFRVSQ